MLDTAIALWASGLPRIPFWDHLMAIVTHANDHGLVWILPTLVLLAYKPTRRTGLACAIALILATVAGHTIKPLVARPRPFQTLGLPLIIPPPGGYSFPSAHAGSSFAAATVLFLRLRGWPGWAALLLAALISFSRIFFTVHYFSDVVVGALLGVACGIAALWLTNRNSPFFAFKH